MVTEVYPDGRFKFIHASTSQGTGRLELLSLLCSTICRSPTHLFRSNRQTTDFLDAILELEDIDDNTPFTETEKEYYAAGIFNFVRAE